LWVPGTLVNRPTWVAFPSLSLFFPPSLVTCSEDCGFPCPFFSSRGGHLFFPVNHRLAFFSLLLAFPLCPDPPPWRRVPRHESCHDFFFYSNLISFVVGEAPYFNHSVFFFFFFRENTHPLARLAPWTVLRTGVSTP